MFSRAQLRGVVAVAAAVCLPAVAMAAQPLGIAWRNNLDAAKIEAAQSNRLLLLHFYTQSCGPCKLLDQNVLSQPQVGVAVERDYVPVKIDADKSPALANMFKIDRVPTEIVLTAQGELVATLSTPDNPDGYTAQLANLARHYRQTTPGAGPESPPATINSAYASLQPSAVAQPSVGATPSATTTTTAAAPQVQANPYVGAPPVMSLNAQTAPAAGAVAGAATGAIAANSSPAMPTNAMPQSYRYPAVTAPPSTAGAAIPGAATAGAIAGATAGATAQNPATVQPTNPATNPIASQTTNPAPNPTTAIVATSPAVITPPQGATVRPTQPPLPANSPPVAFDGCCPVTLKSQNRWAAGSTAFGAIHRGRTYLFVGEQERQQFLAAPDSYSPVFAGYDPVLLLDKQQSVPGSRKFGYRFGGSFYLFSNQETMDRFKTSPQTYAAGVRQAMAHVDGTADAVIRR